MTKALKEFGILGLSYLLFLFRAFSFFPLFFIYLFSQPFSGNDLKNNEKKRGSSFSGNVVNDIYWEWKFKCLLFFHCKTFLFSWQSEPVFALWLGFLIFIKIFKVSIFYNFWYLIVYMIVFRKWNNWCEKLAVRNYLIRVYEIKLKVTNVNVYKVINWLIDWLIEKYYYVCWSLKLIFGNKSMFFICLATKKECLITRIFETIFETCFSRKVEKILQPV